jgi:uncharacterized protein with PIN domain
MKFIADAMLGRLAKWLRLLGFDVLYYPAIEDRKLIRIVREQERILLTRDTRLLKQKALKEYIYIKSNDIFGQLLEIKGELNFRDAELPGRCIICNGLLYNIPQKREIKESVPDFIYHSFDSFIKCRECGKVYWEGTHHKRIKDTIAEILSTPYPKGDMNNKVDLHRRKKGIEG